MSETSKAAVEIVCPKCLAINRVPADKPALEAKCGACHEKLFTGKPVEVDAAAFERHVSKNQIPVLVDIWAPWCGPCRMMAPHYERAAAELEPRVRLLKLNSDENPEIARRLGVRGIPSLFLFYRGNVLAQTAGAMGTPQIVAFVERAMATA
jgi:thioredoxin 2